MPKDEKIIITIAVTLTISSLCGLLVFIGTKMNLFSSVIEAVKSLF